MARTTGIGIQDFEKIRMNQYFYVDKTSFIKEWWDGGDMVYITVKMYPCSEGTDTGNPEA